ncbi:aspartate/glutamate racemase family protein [Hydrogenophaga sp. 5NK40-0174]|uniref:aspartate/glutamate racemase family protein n=1 Tax=Hydrogenophaga sp. 5NK40-0174 TaxID=3127649 RepID=UPI0031047AF0
MKQLLIINPNTTSSVSERMRAHAQALAGERAHVTVATAAFGARYIANEASYAVAAHAALDTWAGALAEPPFAQTPPDAVLIGCFGDPGLFALRESSAVPVSGLAEASFLSAAALGRFAIVTGGERWAPMLRRLAQNLGMGEHLTSIVTVAPTGAELAADPSMAQRELGRACQQAVSSGPVDAIILGGAGLVGMVPLVQDSVPVPVLDSVLASVQRTIDEELPPPVRPSNGFDAEWTSLPPHMNRH